MEEVTLSESLSKAKKIKKDFKEIYGADIARCYQCGKCAAGCPLSEKMDYDSCQMIHLLQQGRYEEALNSKAIWYCVGCETCSARCPREVYPSKVMEGLHMEAVVKGHIGDRDLHIFHKNFLGLVRRYGRVHEMELMIRHNLLTGKFLKDALFAPQMLMKGKLPLLPHKIQAQKEVEDIFRRCEELRGEGK
ncbi:MAG: 4Fe-4S dicluster domain-containing protein [Bacillota bacterium]|nr:4Fe-4S dicluster domain-containing protein [Bacillota bacterium]